MALNWELLKKINAMKFLDELADHLLSEHGENLRDTIVVLPARRSGLFLKRAISKRSGHSGWLPELLTMSELLERMSKRQRADGIDLLFDLFDVYRSKINANVSLESFMQWGPIALGDFNEIDHNLSNAKDVFKNLHDFKEIEAWSFGEDEDLWSENQKAYAEFWLELGQLYVLFQERMKANNSWYGGAVARSVADDPIAAFESLKCNHIVIAGMNALTAAEYRIIKKLKDAGLATYRWDADSYYISQKSSEAGLFIKRFKDLDPREIPDHFTSKKKKIKLVGCSSTVTQMQYLGDLLKDIPNEEATETAVILPDNAVLPVLLPTVPEHFDGINVTMGRSLSATPYRSLIASFFRMLDHRHKRIRYTALMPFLRHTFTGGASSKSGRSFAQLATSIVKENAVFVDDQEVKTMLASFKDPDEKVAHFFTTVFEAISAKTADNIIKALVALQDVIRPHSEAEPEIRQGWNLLCGLTARIGRLCQMHPVIHELREFERLYNRLFTQLQIDLVGEPLVGLQIMGLLESRALDFKRVIIVNANEGILPRQLQVDTFLPADLRAFLRLPSARERDAYYAYYFYRLLQRAEEVHIVYTDAEPGHNDGEKSRFIQQIESCRVIAHSPIDLQKLQVMSLNSGPPPEIPAIQTGAYTAERIAAILERGLSPSAFNLWLQNPREFFFRYVLSLGEQDDVEEEIEHRTLGTIVHEVIEDVFKSLLHVTLDPEALKAKRSELAPMLDKALEKNYNIKLTRFGVNYLLKKVALSFADKLLNVSISEARNHEVIVESLEEKLRASLTDGISLHGMADRIDRFDGQLRIIDYKTGKVIQKDLTLKPDWQEDLRNGKSPKALQCLIYSWIVAKSKPHEVISAGIISSRNHTSGFIPLKSGKEPLLVDSTFVSTFEEWMLATIATLKSEMAVVDYNPSADYPTYSENLG